jgi:hypothetical protein
MSQPIPVAGPLHRFFSADHDRLDDLLRHAMAGSGPIDLDLFAALRGFPEPPLKPYNDGPQALKHIEENLALSRRQWL